jgi:3-hydroxymyristoyl/3-hydroxydecanoyl-(acyl carrier protein) dehydratase
MIEPLVSAVVQSGPDQVRISLVLPSDHPAFAGHFPGQPILPGVVQIDWATRLADTYLASGFLAACDFQVKFRQVITPEAALSLDLRFDRVHRVLEFSYRIGDAVVSSGRIRPEAV